MKDSAAQTALRETANNASITPKERLDALARYMQEYPVSAESCGENNNHIHTVYSFSPYTPTMAALRAKEAGLDVAGSVDHDSIGAAGEMRAACKILKLGCVTGFEVRVSLKHTEFAARKINNPDSPGLAYMTVQGVPSDGEKKVRDFLKPVQEARAKRNKKMVTALNELLTQAAKQCGSEIIAPLSYESDILPLSKAAEGGGVTERHLLYAFSLRLIEKYGRSPTLPETLKTKLNVKIPPKIELLLMDAANPHYAYDLLGLLKSGFLDGIFIQPGADECPPAETVTAFARSIGAVPAYAYLGDVGESPTGDKKAEKFEDDYLDKLFAELKKLGFLAVTYMPPRNTREQLLRVQSLCKEYGFMEISGVDINSSRQSFHCPELRRAEFAHLIDATWALVAHEALASYNVKYGIFSSENPLARNPLTERTGVYARLGREMEPVGAVTVEKAAQRI